MIRRFAADDEAERGPLPKLTYERILAWADEFHQRNAEWPVRDSGPIPDAEYPGESWLSVEAALSIGLRGLPGRDTLPRLLARERSRRNIRDLPALTTNQILRWADAHHRATGKWPHTGTIDATPEPGETWLGIDAALRMGRRGLKAGSSLPRLLAEQRGVRNTADLPQLTVKKILKWADAHRRRTGAWPLNDPDMPAPTHGETWSGIDVALRAGARGLPGGSSLARLLARERGKRNTGDLPALTVKQILKWADEHHQLTGEWPQKDTRNVAPESGESWPAVDAALRAGGRELRGGSSLAKLLASRRGVRNIRALPQLTFEQILRWADQHHQRTGCWPKRTSGTVRGATEESWSGVDAALKVGTRGLPGGSSLSRFLQRERGARNHRALPELSVHRILAWADAHHGIHGNWPNASSGPVDGVPGQTWSAANAALIAGLRGLPGGSSLAQLLAKSRGARNRVSLPPLRQETILLWADQHHRRTGQWPNYSTNGEIHGTRGETWAAVRTALENGVRGLPGGSSLAQLLAEHRGVRNGARLPALTVQQILRWADTHHRRTGAWPNKNSGPIVGAPGETWKSVYMALVQRGRGLRERTTLAQLLADQRGVRNITALPQLTEEKIVAWADAHHRRTGRWPTRSSGPIVGAAGESWSAVAQALVAGARGLQGGSSLAQLLARRRGVRNTGRLRPLSADQILKWADEHHRKTGCWPKASSGPVVQSPGETWANVNAALNQGGRGLAAGSSLARLLAKHRNVRNPLALPRLTIRMIVAWARAHYLRSGRWPTSGAGEVAGVPGERWPAIDIALRHGNRGLKGGSSLTQLLRAHRPPRE